MCGASFLLFVSCILLGMFSTEPERRSMSSFFGPDLALIIKLNAKAGQLLHQINYSYLTAIRQMATGQTMRICPL